MAGGYTRLSLTDQVEDAAAAAGMPGMEARFPARPLGLAALAFSLQRLGPGVRQPFGHRHLSQEEVYLVVEGGGRARLDDDTVELGTWDALRVAPETWRCFEAGERGMAFVAIGAPPMEDPHRESEMRQGWWGG